MMIRIFLFLILCSCDKHDEESHGMKPEKEKTHTEQIPSSTPTAPEKKATFEKFELSKLEINWSKIEYSDNPDFLKWKNSTAPKKEFLLLIFRKEANCDLCNKSETKLLDQYFSEFKKLSVLVFMISPDSLPQVVLPRLNDTEQQLYKKFGMYDEIKKEARHGIVVLDSQSNARILNRTDHAFSDWEKLKTDLKSLTVSAGPAK